MPSDLLDGFGRKIDYVRMSVTDRCDFRCIYCMAEDMVFLPRTQILSLEEIERCAKLFVAQGVRKIRLTGGEPLTRKGIIGLCKKISAIPGLDELVMTTNGSQLVKYAQPLVDAGVKRLNISLDSLCPEKFNNMTRTGKLEQVLAGIQAARTAGFERVKINSVIIQGHNDEEILALTEYAIDNQIDITFIEEMPLGHVGRSRETSLFSSKHVRERIAERYQLLESFEDTGGPARYMRLKEFSNTRIGFISPHSHNFCSTCNRVRLTAEGKLLLCLGNEHSLDMLQLLRKHDDAAVLAQVTKALQNKPEQHHFSAEGDVQIVRFMNASGG